MWYQLLVGDLDERPGTDWREALAGSGAGPAEIDVLGRCLVGRADRRLRDAGALLDALDALEGHADEPAPEADDDIDGDDPSDLADRLQRSLREAQRALALARDMAEKRHDYAAAVRRLEGIPSGFCDSSLLEVYRERRDRVYELRRQIYPAARRGHFAGLRDRIADLLMLTPGDEKVRRLLAVVPYLPGPEVVNAVGMRLMLLPAGTFAMGSPHGEAGRQACEGPVRPVAMARPFYLGAHPVTQSQFERVLGTNPARFRHVSGHDTTAFPVENVTWHEADEFCRRLSALPGEVERGRRYRLPTEAEWEYACRAGEASQPFSTGRSLSSSQANFDGRRPYGHAAFGEFRGRTIRVGTFAANAWGLFDMHGNVWEWCADLFDPATGEARVMRGGSWQNHAASCRAASRDWIGPGYRGCTVGFRVVLEVAE
jgi:formylglycine-generating enzyme required for sulfatase activity